MKMFLNLCVLTAILCCTAFNITAQDDEQRQQSGLPTFIGPRPTTVPGNNSTLAGTLVIQGFVEENNPPTFTITVVANGVVVAKQIIKNRGSFNFNGLPQFGVALTVEADGLEIGNFPVGTLSPAPLANRQDILLPWSQVGQTIKQRNEVISIRNSYQRSAENQKLFDKAMASLKEKKNDNSLKMLKELLEKDANDFVAWTELGNIYFTNKKFADADKSYNKALALKSDFLPALTNLGKLYLAEKKLDQSIEILTKALAIAPESADINHYLGEAYLQSKTGSKAVVYLNQAIKLAPIEKAELHLRLAALYNAANVKDRAIAEYKMFLEKVPNHPEKATIEKYIRENSPK